VLTDQIVKLDVDHPAIASEDMSDGSVRVWREEGCVPGEPIFVPSPGAEAEDDGVVLSVVLDGRRARSMLLVLDAGDMKELARAEMEIPFPLGFHGAFIP
jgi:carotenoid cleavage dioxygenase-like enzyme